MEHERALGGGAVEELFDERRTAFQDPAGDGFGEPVRVAGFDGRAKASRVGAASGAKVTR